jgi:5-methylcytosine-specific restriction endonuclease McrA
MGILNGIIKFLDRTTTLNGWDRKNNKHWRHKTYGKRNTHKKVQTKKRVVRYTSSREPIPIEVQQYVWRRDNGRCVKCGSQIKLEFDHIIPISRGGSNTARNIQLLCERCNRSKWANIGE